MKFPCDVIIHYESNKKGTKVAMTGWNELIRCKDCKHMHEDGAESYCDDSGRYIDGTGFCSWAERKEE